MALYIEPVRSDFYQLYPGRAPYDDPLGPLNCQPHSTSRAIMRHYEGQKPANIRGVWPPTGEYIRSVTKNPDGTYDRSGGTNLGQMEAVCKNYYGMDLEVHYGLPWADVIKRIQASKGASLSIHYKVIHGTKYSGSETFSDNHQIYINGVDLTRGVFTYVVDPLADGRRPGLFKGPAEYPIELLKRAAGALDVDGRAGSYRALGYGLAYVGFTQGTGLAPIPAPTWRWYLASGATVRIYTLSSAGCIQPGWQDIQWGANASSAPCTAPVSRKTCNGLSTATTVRITAGAFAGKTVRAFGDGVTTRRIT